MPPISIIPTCKLLVTYDIQPNQMDKYYQYVLQEFVPELQNMGLYMFRVWHVAYGDYPVRQLEFISEDLESVMEVFETDRWTNLETELKSFTLNYERKLVHFRHGFQF
jgi:hypothetical protein